MMFGVEISMLSLCRDRRQLLCNVLSATSQVSRRKITSDD